VFLGEVLCLPHRSSEEQLYWNRGLERFEVLISLKVKLLLCESLLLEKSYLIEKRIKGMNPPQRALGVISKSPRPRDKKLCLSCSRVYLVVNYVS
jgi:hypothetical protein